MQSKLTLTKQRTTARVTTTTQRKPQLIKQSKIEQQQATKMQRWAIWRLYWQARPSQQYLEWLFWQLYGAAWSILEINFGRPHVIIIAQLESICKANQLKPHNSAGPINFSAIVSTFVNGLKEYKQIDDPQSSSALYRAFDKLPEVLKEKWCFCSDDKMSMQGHAIK